MNILGSVIVTFSECVIHHSGHLRLWQLHQANAVGIAGGFHIASLGS